MYTSTRCTYNWWAPSFKMIATAKPMTDINVNTIIEIPFQADAVRTLIIYIYIYIYTYIYIYQQIERIMVMFLVQLPWYKVRLLYWFVDISTRDNVKPNFFVDFLSCRYTVYISKKITTVLSMVHSLYIIYYTHNHHYSTVLVYLDLLYFIVYTRMAIRIIRAISW